MSNQKRILSNLYISAFCREISMLMKAGMPLEQGLLSMADEERTKEGKELISNMTKAMEEGESFYNALLAEECFPKYVTDMVLVGEKTGQLETILHNLSLYYQKEEDFYNNLKSAIMYPFIMIVMMFVVLMVLVLKVLPMFNDVYSILDSSIPAVAVTIMQWGSVISKIALVFFGIACAGFIVSFLYGKATHGKKLFSVGRLFQNSKISCMIDQSRISSVMYIALSSGLELDYALDLARELVKTDVMKSKVTKCKELLDAGESFSDSIEKAEIMKGTYAGILGVGFRTGSADTVMKDLSDRYSEEADEKLFALVSAVEPALVITMSVLVGVILLSVMMPLMGIMASIG